MGQNVYIHGFVENAKLLCPLDTSLMFWFIGLKPVGNIKIMKYVPNRQSVWTLEEADDPQVSSPAAVYDALCPCSLG